MSLDYSPNANGVSCPACDGSFRYVGTQSARQVYALYYCENNVELGHRDEPDKVVGNEDTYCNGMCHVYEDGRVTVSGGDMDEPHVVVEGRN
jgi:hypothetical protein